MDEEFTIEEEYIDDEDIGLDDDDDDGGGYINVGAGPALDSLMNKLRGQRGNAKAYTATLAKARFKPSLTKVISPKIVTTLNRMAQISKSVNQQIGRIEADILRRPNSLCCVYGTTLAPAATVAFSITPSGGQSWYRVLAFLSGDDQAQVFGFTSLKVGGLDQIFATQTTPTPPVANASAWYGFVARGDGQVFNLSPWTGTVFENSVTISGTIVNMTVAATGDAITLAPRFLIPVQTDPCGQNSMQARVAATKFRSNLLRGLNMYR